MRTMAVANLSAYLASALIVGGATLSLTSAAAATPMSGGMARGAAASSGSSVELIQSGSSYCDQLRRGCLYKHELGEQGAGNCSRYRAECGGRAGYNSYSRYRSYRAYRPSYPSWR
jgi:hypothetical protein